MPYQYRLKVVREIPLNDGRVERREVEETEISNAYFLPEALSVRGDVQTQLLHRGIYDAAVFRMQVVLSGRFTPPGFAARFFRRNESLGQTASMRSGRFPTTAAIIRSSGRAGRGISASTARA